MAYDASYHEWVQPRRWRRLRRWFARLLALLALGACGAGVYLIARDATAPAQAGPVSLQPEVRQVAESSAEVGRRLSALRKGASTAAALTAVREAQGDQQEASAALAQAQAHGKVRDATLLAAALAAHRRYLSAVSALLRNPRSKVGRVLRTRAKRAKAAWAALPDPAGLPDSIRGWRRVAALAHARSG